MSTADIIAIIIVGTCSVVTMAFVFLRMLEGRQQDRKGADDATDPELVSVNAEVAKLRAEVSELRRRKPLRQSTFMDMADALNRIANPPVNYDEASLEVPLMDMALGKVVKVRLLSGKEVSFRLPAKTKSGTKFRFRRGGEEGRDLHLTVRATPVETP